MGADHLIDRVRRLHRPRYMTTGLLTIELGFQALDRRDAHLLFMVISYR